MKALPQSRLPDPNDILRSFTKDEMVAMLWSEKVFAEQREPGLEEVRVRRKMTREAKTRLRRQIKQRQALHPAGTLPLAQDLGAFSDLATIDIQPGKKQRPFEHVFLAAAIQANYGTPSLLSYGYLAPERGGPWFYDALAPYYPNGQVPLATRNGHPIPAIPSNSDVFGNMTRRPKYYLWEADIGAIAQNIDKIHPLLHGNFWVDLGSFNAEKLVLLRDMAKAHGEKTGKPFEPAMNGINEIISLDGAHKTLLEGGVPADKILRLPGDFESHKFWHSVNVAYHAACKKAIAGGKEPPKLVITNFGGTAGNRGPEGLKRQIKTMRRELTGEFIYAASIDGTGTRLTPADCADPDSKDLHGKTREEIRKMEAQGRVAVEAAYDIPETKHFAHMSVFNMLERNGMIDDPRELRPEIRFRYPEARCHNVSAVQFVVTNRGEKLPEVKLPDYRQRKKSVDKLPNPDARRAPKSVYILIEDGFEFLHEPLSKMGRAHTKNLFKKAGAECVERLPFDTAMPIEKTLKLHEKFGSFPDRYPRIKGLRDRQERPPETYVGVNHAIYVARFPKRRIRQPSPASQSSAQACPN